MTTKRTGTILMGGDRPTTDPALLATQVAATSHSDSLPSSGHIGYVLAGKYRITRLVGEGGMGAVYEGEHLEIGKRVAIKLVHAAMSGTADVAERFRREARAAAAIESEHIVQVFDVGQDPALGLFMVMEFLRGQDLAHTIVDGGPLEATTASALVIQAATALEAAHAAGIVHRDLKPANIFLVPRADGSTLAKLVDFGIAKVRDGGGPQGAGITRVGSALGTPQYMAPEQAQGLPDIDLRVDVYALGCVLYEAVTGRAAYAELPTYEQMIIQLVTKPTPHIRELVPEVPAALDALCAEMMHREPAMRPASMTVVIERLLSIIPDAGAPVYLESVEGEGRMSRVARSRGTPARPRLSSVGSPTTPSADAVALDSLDEVAGVPRRSNGARYAAFAVLGIVAILGAGAVYMKLGRPAPVEPQPAAAVTSAPPPRSAEPASSVAPSVVPDPVVTPVASASSAPPKASVAPSVPPPKVGGPLPPPKPPKGGNGKVGSAGVAEQF